MTTKKIQNKLHPLYNTWRNMRARCNRKTHPRYADWGGRGIEVCKRWDSFKVFADDMGDRPTGHTLDRVDNNKNYTPDNCKWSTISEQNSNQRIRKDNTSGVKGVKVTKQGRYQVCISLGGATTKCLGTYPTLEQAKRVSTTGVAEPVSRMNNTSGYPYVYLDKVTGEYYKMNRVTRKCIRGFKTAKDANNVRT